ncbi:MAG: class I SAM-dependent methyltransferase [Armatimonadota bacterium]|nr:class I SAM-dependent methyltransferase [bacterium]
MMATHPVWQYDEFKQIGTDYESVEEVARYDKRMSSLRNIDEECAAIIELLDLGPDSRVLEIGSGTGEFAIAAAKQCAQVCAVDISQIMLDYAREKAISRSVNNIQFARAGFLTYDHDGKPFDAVVTQLALHHLPDFWKAIALRRIWHMLKDGGRLFIRDVVFSFNVDDAASYLDKWIDGAVAVGGERLGQNIESHIRDEFSTFDWAMESLLRASGFSISRITNQDNRTFAEYLCKKV